jgi:hypothetical protein
MAQITITETLDAGNDVLVVKGIVDGEEVQARGWFSAMNNHYDEHAYGEDGHLKTELVDPGKDGSAARPAVHPREMSPEEKKAYCERLLADAWRVQHPPAFGAVKLF